MSKAPAAHLSFYSQVFLSFFWASLLPPAACFERLFCLGLLRLVQLHQLFLTRWHIVTSLASLAGSHWFFSNLKYPRICCRRGLLRGLLPSRSPGGVSGGNVGVRWGKPSGLILASDGLIRYTFSADNVKTSVACFQRRRFWARIGRIPIILVQKICRYKSITGGKVGSGRGLGCWPGLGIVNEGFSKSRGGYFRSAALDGSPPPHPAPPHRTRPVWKEIRD